MSFRSLNPIQRRRKVAQFRLRGLSTREIAEKLTQEGEPVVHTTIVRDLAVIEADWRKEAARDLGVHKARLLAENQLHRRVLWNKPELHAAGIQRSLEFEAKLLGLYDFAPPTVDVVQELADLGLDPAAIIHQVEALLAGT